MELGEHIPCDVCRMLLNGRDQYDDHLKGKLHRKNRRRQRSQASAVLGNDDDVHPPRRTRPSSFTRLGAWQGLRAPFSIGRVVPQPMRLLLMRGGPCPADVTVAWSATAGMAS